MTTMIVPADVRNYLQLNATASSSQYTDSVIQSNIDAAISTLEQACSRYFADHTFTSGTPWTTTSMLRAQVPIPGFRTFTTVTYGGSTVTANESYWAIPDAQQTGVYTALQFRAWRADFAVNIPGTPHGWWVADSLWYDKALDSPFYPGNYGGGYAWVSMPNDMTIVGSAGYALGTEPGALLHAVLVLASFYTMRSASILADVAITPAGGVLNYSQMPSEVQAFVRDWRVGQGVVSVG